MLETVDHQDPFKNRAAWNFSISLDDLLWMQSVNSFRYVEKKWNNADMPNDERILYRLLHKGLLDIRDKDKQFFANTRSMRFTSVVAEKLWAIVEREQLRVGGGFSGDLAPD